MMNRFIHGCRNICMSTQIINRYLFRLHHILCMKLKSKLLHPITFLVFLSFVLTLWWFHICQMIASGEEALLFYDRLRTIKIFLSPWYETGMGTLNPVMLP